MKMLTTISAGGIALGEHIVVHPNDPPGKNLAHTTACVALNAGACAAEFFGATINQPDHHTKLLALLGPGVAVRPWTLISPTVDMRHRNQATHMWTWIQYACGRAVADCVEENVIQQGVAESLLIGLQVYSDPEMTNNEESFQTQYWAAYRAICNAVNGTQDVATTLKSRTSVVHCLCKHPDAEGKPGPVYDPAEIQKLIDEVRKPTV